MIKVSTTIIVKGEEKKISVWIEDETVELLNKCEDKEFVKNYIVDAYKEAKLNRNETRRHQSLNASMDNGFDIADESVNIEESAIKRFDSERLHKAINMLEPQQKWLIEQVYFEDRKQVDIAKELGITKMAVTNRLKKIFVKLKKFFN